MASGYRNTPFEYAVMPVSLDASGNGVVSVVWTESFATAPLVLVVPHANDSGSWVASNVTNTGATLTATGSDTRSATISVVLIAHEKL